MTKTNHYFLLAGMLLFTVIARAQTPVLPTYEPAIEVMGNIFGKILDAGNAKPMEDVSVQLIRIYKSKGQLPAKEQILFTQYTNHKGEFHLTDVPMLPDMVLRVWATGYTMTDHVLDFGQVILLPENDGGNRSRFIKDIGNIRLRYDARDLDNITVSGSRSLLQLKVNKRIYNVEKDLMSNGGTTTDILRNVPGIAVDIDGNITLRNGTPQVFIDGRPTTLTTDQLPAAQVSGIEIMTNPSAKFDANGGSGIINILLKKNHQPGYNGNLRASIDSRIKPGISGDINIKKNKFNFFAAASLLARRSITDVRTHKTDTLENGIGQYAQTNRPVNNNYTSFARVGFDYFMDNRNTATWQGSLGQGIFRVSDRFNISRDSILTSGNSYTKIDRILNVHAGNHNYGTGMSFKHNFSKPGKELTFDGTYNYNKTHNTSDYKSYILDANNFPGSIFGAQRATGGNESHSITFQADYSSPFNSIQKIEYGMRLSSRKFMNRNDNYVQDISTLMYRIVPEIGVEYNFTDQVMAAYLNYSETKDRLNYQLGLRFENSSYSGSFITKDTRFSTHYPASFFPSVFAGYKLTDKSTLQLNYSRKINRPAYFQLVPFVDFSDSLNLNVGNPALKAEFIDVTELSYSKQYGKSNSIIFSAYYKYSKGLITRYQFNDSVINPSRPGLYSSFANARHGATTGLEIIALNKVSNRWDITGNLNLYNSAVDAANLGIATLERFSWFARLNNSFRLPEDFSIQLSAEYQAKTLLPPGSGANRSNSNIMYGYAQVTAQGYIKHFYGADCAIKKDFLKNNAASLTLQLSDFLRIRKYDTYSSGNGFSQNNSRRRDPQLFRLSFNWRFGKSDMYLLKRKNARNDLDNIPVQQPGQ